MEFKIEELGEIVKADIVKLLSNNEAIISIDNKEFNLKILNKTPDTVEFLLNNKYHHVKYINNTTIILKLQIDKGEIVTINKFPYLQTTVSSMVISSQNILQSPIPGRVISIEAKPNIHVKKGDVIAIVESMKMRVAIKAHKDGIVKEIKIKEGTTISRNDPVAIIE